MILPPDVVIEGGGVVRGGGAATDVPWWSFTKTVISAAALCLVRDGRLELDAPIADRPWTLRQLMQHRAGLADYGRLPDYHEAVARGDDVWPVEELLARCRADHLVYRPGEGWSYSNIGYLYVRWLVEEAAQEALGPALVRLVLAPLGAGRARLASERHDLDGVVMGETRGYDPRWAYHGLLVGPLEEAALLLDRLMTQDLLPQALKAAMLQAHPVGGPVAGRPWLSPGYGLGLMCGGVKGGLTIAGHTGGGPGSVAAVYHLGSAPLRRTAAAFSLGDDQGLVEDRCVALLAGWRVKEGA